jgi:hypothetical protein
MYHYRGIEGVFPMNIKEKCKCGKQNNEEGNFMNEGHFYGRWEIQIASPQIK